jgi:hypothetical protein
MQDAGAAREFAAAHVAQDGEQPRLDLRPAKGVEMAQRAQIALLHGVFGIAAVAEQVSGQGINVIEIRQRGVAKSPRLVLLSIAAVARPRAVSGFPGQHRAPSLRSIEHHCPASVPATASTTTAPVMCGCKEQKYA